MGYAVENLKNLVGSVKEEWGHAEKIISTISPDEKSAHEQLPPGLLQAAIVELRYAGRLLQNVLPDIINCNPHTEDHQVKMETVKDLVDIISCCVRAQHDAIDATIDLCTKLFYKLTMYDDKLIREQGILQVEVDEVYKLLMQLEDETINSRGEDGNKRRKIYTNIADNHLKKLSEYTRALYSTHLKLDPNANSHV